MGFDLMASTFVLDEAPLRQWILTAYHENRKLNGAPRRTLAAIRQLLSGAPGGESLVARYWFEEDPRASAKSFVQDLERAAPGLAHSVLDPVLSTFKQMEARESRDLAPNLPVLVSSLAGPVALRSGIDELLASAALSAAFLGISRAGREPFETALSDWAPNSGTK